MAHPSLELDGHVALVTGAGRGIGRAHALELARRGVDVVVNDLDREAAESVVEDIVGMGGRAVPNSGSVTTPSGGEGMVKAAVQAYGTLDIVVHNAGILRPGYFEDLSLEEIDAVLDTHLRSGFFVIQPAWRILKAKGYGRVVLTSSASGMFSHQAMTNYAAAKAGVYGLGRALAYEGRAHGILVNVVCPYAATTIGADHPIPDFAQERAKYVSPDDEERVLAHRRDPALIAQLCAVLASPQCPTSGETYSICAGRYARVFVGVSAGWMAPQPADVTAEHVLARFEQIQDLADFSVPISLYEEVADVVQRLLAEHGGPR